MAEATKRPSTRERKAHSARARLTPPHGPTMMDKAQNTVAKERKERVHSAKANRDKQMSSTRVFRSNVDASKGRFTSMYSKDFDGTYMPPPDLRPTSPTRRNNPHPAKQFMVWKLPSREIGGEPYEEGLLLPPEHLARNTDFDAIDELSGRFDNLKLPPPRPTSTDYGAYLHKLPQLRQNLRRGDEMRGRHKQLRPVSSEVIDRTVVGGNKEALESWLQTATPEEQHTVLKMLKSAEEAKVKETINTVMQPQAAKAVQGWLKGADEKEREVAVRLFSSLGSRPKGMRPRSRSESDASFMRPPSRKPVPPQGRPPSQHGRLQSAPTGPRPRPWPAGIWHHKPIRDPPPQVYHRGSLFGAVRGGASHFKIHPEWPDYYPHDDVVH